LSKKWSLAEYVCHNLTDAQGWDSVSSNIAEGQAKRVLSFELGRDAQGWDIPSLTKN
jgi:hypothetical protein